MIANHLVILRGLRNKLLFKNRNVRVAEYLVSWFKSNRRVDARIIKKKNKKNKLGFKAGFALDFKSITTRPREL